MDRLRALQVFVAVADTQSFARAARQLGLSAPATTRAIAALERRLGIRLFARTTRHVRLTEAGRRYLEDARRILAELDEADAAAAGVNGEPRGTLTLTAPVLFGRLFVSAIVVEYLQRHAQTRIEALFVDRVTNLVEEGIDVGIRIAELADSGLQAIRVGAVRRVVCAAPAYLDAHGTPREPRELERHQLISATGASSNTGWRFGKYAGPARAASRLVVSANDAAREAACLGLGLARLLSYQIAHDVAHGRLRIVLEQHEPAPIPVHVVHREGPRGSARTRAFVDLAVARLRAHPALASPEFSPPPA